jgi:hypothetical protein
MTTTATPVDNGVNVEALLGVRDLLPDTPEIARFQWRSTTSWVNGTHSRSDVETSRRPHGTSCFAYAVAVRQESIRCADSRLTPTTRTRANGFRALRGAS